MRLNGASMYLPAMLEPQNGGEAQRPHLVLAIRASVAGYRLSLRPAPKSHRQHVPLR